MLLGEECLILAQNLEQKQVGKQFEFLWEALVAFPSIMRKDTERKNWQYILEMESTGLRD